MEMVIRQFRCTFKTVCKTTWRKSGQWNSRSGMVVRARVQHVCCMFAVCLLHVCCMFAVCSVIEARSFIFPGALYLSIQEYIDTLHKAKGCVP